MLSLLTKAVATYHRYFCAYHAVPNLFFLKAELMFSKTTILDSITIVRDYTG